MFTLKGIYAPIPTPFVDENGPIAYDKLEKNMDFWAGSDLTGIVVMGSNGEFVSLNPQEKKEIVRACCTYMKGKKSVVVGTGCETTRDTIELCEYAAMEGADAALVLSPNYYKRAMSDKVNKAFYVEVADKSPIPVILYNMPGNSGINLTSGFVADVASHPNIIGIKDSGGNIVQISEILHKTPDDFAVFAGSGSFLLATLVLGGTGGTLALANILPNECARVQKLAEEGNIEEAAALQLELLEMNAAVTSRWGIGGLKAAMELRGLYGGMPRKPLLPLGEEERGQLKALLEPFILK